MPIRIPMDGNSLNWLADPRSVEAPMYFGQVVLDENFYVNQANSSTNTVTRCRGLNAIVDLTDPAGTSFSYVAENGAIMTATIGHNGFFPVRAFGITAMAAGITNLEWWV